MDHKKIEKYGKSCRISECFEQCVCELYFTQRSARDRYKLIVDNFKKREQEEAAVKDEMHKKNTVEKKSKNESDTIKSAVMRRRSLETFSESNARCRNESMVKKSRNTGRETVQYLRENGENKLKLRTES